MKKTLLIAMIGSVVFSCKKQNFQLPADVKTQTVKTNSSGDGKYDLLGFGYDVTREFANSNSSKAQVLNVQALDLGNPGRVVPGNNKTQYGQASYGENAQSASIDMTKKVNVSTGYGLFKGSLDLTYTSSDATSSKYTYGFFNLIIQQKSWALNAAPTLLQQYLSPAFLADIQNPNTTPAYIVAHYGTHVLSHIILGGKLQVILQTQTSSSDRKSSAAASLQVTVSGLFHTDAGYSSSVNQASTSSNYSQNLTFLTHGGDPSKGLVGSIEFGSGATTSQKPIDIASWQSSCQPENAELIDIDKADGLIPIYDLIPSTYSTLKSGLQTYINEYFRLNQVTVTPAPIYEFYHGQADKHAYSTYSFGFSDKYAGFVLNGQPFKAFYSNYGSSSIPVYQFVSNQTGDHVYTTNITPGWAGYRYDGVLFYTSPSSVPGTVPVYEFYNKTSGDHFYSTDRNAAAPYPGWAYNAQPFYAYPNNN